jgi:hypothetical protein
MIPPPQNEFELLSGLSSYQKGNREEGSFNVDIYHTPAKIAMFTGMWRRQRGTIQE